MVSVELVWLQLCRLTERHFCVVGDLRIDYVLSLGLLLAVVRLRRVSVRRVVSFVVHSFLLIFFTRLLATSISSWRPIWCGFG